VILGIKNKHDLKKAIKKIKAATGSNKFLVQTMQEKGLEMIIGMKRDKSFGPVLMAGLGGTLTEVFRDNIILIPPLSRTEIENKLEKLIINPILKGFRGEKGYKIQEISSLLLTTQKIAIENPKISEIDINPVILYNNGRKPVLVDVKIFISLDT
jgi:acyl-CoA synthetase (NDP forming)